MADEHPPLEPFQQSADTRLLIARLRTLKMGETLSYAALSELVGQEVDASFGPLFTARERLRKDYEMIIGVQAGKGVVRLTDEQIVEDAAINTNYMRRKSRRIAAKLEVAEYNALTSAGKLQHSAILSTARAMAFLSGGRQIEKMGRQIAAAGSKALPIREIMNMFSKGGRKEE